MTMDTDNLCLFCFENTQGRDICPACGHSRHEPQDNLQELPRGTILKGQYLIGRALGQGGFGITYLAYDFYLDEKVAVKEYFPSGMVTRRGLTVVPTNSANKGLLDTSVRHFFEEAKILARFKETPNIVHVLNFFYENGTAYFAMEYIDGVSLKEFLEACGGRLEWEEARRLLWPIMNTLAEVHKAGIQHRDIAPDNIFITSQGVPKLLDFGAARSEQAAVTRSTNAIIKAGYSPKEQYIAGGKQGPWTDIYALGATFYRVLCGTEPLESILRTKDKDIIPPEKMGVRLPARASQAILKALALEPADRFQSVAEMEKALTDAESPAPISKKKGYLWLALAILAILCALLLIRPGKRREPIPDPTESQAISESNPHVNALSEVDQSAVTLNAVGQPLTIKADKTETLITPSATLPLTSVPTLTDTLTLPPTQTGTATVNGTLISLANTQTAIVIQETREEEARRLAFQKNAQAETKLAAELTSEAKRWTATPLPTSTPRPTDIPTSTPKPKPSRTPTEEKKYVCKGAPDTRIDVGDLVEVCTEKCVNLRYDPDKSASVQQCVDSGVILEVIGGPKCNDGWRWWQVETPRGHQGWISEGDAKSDMYYLEPY